MKKTTFLTLLLAIILAIICFSPGMYLNAATVYSDVLEDLKRDENFTEENYPTYTLDEYKERNNDEDETNDIKYMSVISIAESEDKELFIYVYKPLYEVVDLKALKVSISSEKRTGYEANGQKVYDLELLSSSGLFEKYKVVNYTISSEAERYYNLVSLYREYSELISSEVDETIINATAEVVGQQYVFYMFNDKYTCEMQEFKTMSITVKLTDQILFKSGFTLKMLIGDYTEGYLHYVVFDIDDYIAERIIDADLYFEYRIIEEILESKTESEWVPVYKFLHEDDTASYKPEGLLTSTITWNRIAKANDFYYIMIDQHISFEESVIETLLSSQWVFAFYESEFITDTIQSLGIRYPKYIYQEVQDNTVLRLHFIDDRGYRYNLGVVSDMTSADNDPGGVGGGTDWGKLSDAFNDLKKSVDTFFEQVMLVLGIVLLGLIIIIAFPLLKFVFSGLVLIIKIPFKIIDVIFPKKNK